MTDTNKLMPALLAAQKEMPTVTKDSPNPFFKSKYAGLDSIWSVVKPVLNKHGLVLYQLTGKDEQGYYVDSILCHAESGQSVGGRFYAKPEKENAQGIGSATTYARRYGMQCLLMITPEEDDDGNAASHAEKRQEQREARDLENGRQQKPVNVTKGRRVQEVEPSPFFNPGDDII